MQTKMIEEAADIFIKNLPQIHTGEFDADLLESSNAKQLRKMFKKI